MSDNLERSFLEVARKLKQKKKKRLAQRIALFLAISALVVGAIYWFSIGRTIIKIGNLTIDRAIFIFSIIGLSFICGFVIYTLKKPGNRKNSIFSRLQSSSWQFNRLKQIKRQYLFGFGLLFVVIIAQANLDLIVNPFNNWMVQLRYNPKPPTLNSPWSWADRATVHPAVANMPSDVETSIKSVAEYIAKREPDPYLRVKALHDYVISRVTYDLDVLKSGIRPSQNAETVFATHKGVCEGYAKLFMALGKEIGIDIVYVKGKVRRDLAPIDLISPALRAVNSGYDWTLHAWNAIKILDNWYLVDTTWDDSESATDYKADYLLPPPQVMAIGHFPNESAWQLLERPKSYDAFEKQPILEPEFFARNLMLVSPTEYQTNVQRWATINIKSLPNNQQTIGAVFTKIAGEAWWDLLKDKQAQKPDFQGCQSQENLGGETQISCQFPEAGDYQVFILSREKASIPIGILKFHAL
ncbi:MAG: hypothetical protein KME17_29435 [Cyanosarcina radialis HA8281-LM2]|jgi:hypothetical protein|nr:hypothetical protein [Cyanosarcina radialis HA8281-LM2]